MKICPTCHAEFFGDERFCPSDGSRLVQLEEKSLPASGSRVQQEFERLQSLGRDELGEVFVALDRATGFQIALKEFHPWVRQTDSTLARYRDTLDTLKDNPIDGLPLLISYQMSRQEAYIASELIEDFVTLEGYLDSFEAVPLDQAIEVIAGLLEILSDLHESGLVHGGLTPRKVLLTSVLDPSGLYLTDPGQFELWRVDNPILISRRTPDRYLGSAPYYSPEAALGKELSPQSDLYTVGILLYEILAGKPPFVAKSFATTLKRQIYERPLSPRLVKPGLIIPAEVESLLDTCLAKDPTGRFETAQALRNALLSIKDALPGPRGGAKVTAVPDKPAGTMGGLWGGGEGTTAGPNGPESPGGRAWTAGAGSPAPIPFPQIVEILGEDRISAEGDVSADEERLESRQTVMMPIARIPQQVDEDLATEPPPVPVLPRGEPAAPAEALEDAFDALAASLIEEGGPTPELIREAEAGEARGWGATPAPVAETAEQMPSEAARPGVVESSGVLPELALGEEPQPRAAIGAAVIDVEQAAEAALVAAAEAIAEAESAIEVPTEAPTPEISWEAGGIDAGIEVPAEPEPTEAVAEAPAEPETAEAALEVPQEPEPAEAVAEEPQEPEPGAAIAEAPAEPEPAEVIAEVPQEPEPAEAAAEEPQEPEPGAAIAEVPAEPEPAEVPAELPAEPEPAEVIAEVPQELERVEPAAEVGALTESVEQRDLEPAPGSVQEEEIEDRIERAGARLKALEEAFEQLEDSLLDEDVVAAAPQAPAESDLTAFPHIRVDEEPSGEPIPHLKTQPMARIVLESDRMEEQAPPGKTVEPGKVEPGVVQAIRSRHERERQEIRLVGVFPALVPKAVPPPPVRPPVVTEVPEAPLLDMPVESAAGATAIESGEPEIGFEEGDREELGSWFRADPSQMADTTSQDVPFLDTRRWRRQVILPLFFLGILVIAGIAYLFSGEKSPERPESPESTAELTEAQSGPTGLVGAQEATGSVPSPWISHAFVPPSSGADLAVPPVSGDIQAPGTGSPAPEISPPPAREGTQEVAAISVEVPAEESEPDRPAREEAPGREEVPVEAEEQEEAEPRDIEEQEPIRAPDQEVLEAPPMEADEAAPATAVAAIEPLGVEEEGAGPPAMAEIEPLAGPAAGPTMPLTGEGEPADNEPGETIEPIAEELEPDAQPEQPAQVALMEPIMEQPEGEEQPEGDQAGAERDTTMEAAPAPTGGEDESEGDRVRRSRVLTVQAEESLRNTDYTLAEELFQEAIDLDPRNARAHAGMGDVYFQRQDFSAARRAHRRAISFARTNASYYSRLGMDYFRLGSYLEAIRSWERALELDPTEENARRYIEIARERLE